MRVLSNFSVGMMLLALCVCTVAADNLEVQNLTPVERLSLRLEHVNTLKAHYSQTTIAADGQTLQSSEGSIWVDSRNQSKMFNLTTLRPYAQKLISDGVNFWSFDEELEQVIVSAPKFDAEKMPILLFGPGNKIALDAYIVNVFETEQTEHFILEPKAADSLFKMLTIQFRTDLPVTVTIQDSVGQETTLALMDIQLNTALSKTLFQFKIPAGIDVLDER